MGVVLVILVIVLGSLNIRQYSNNLKLKRNSELCKIDCELRQDRMRALESQLEECNRKRLDEVQPEGNLEVEKPKRKPRRKSTK